jgi:VanZ family protein
MEEEKACPQSANWLGFAKSCLAQTPPWLRWLITVFWMVVIFSFSAQPHSGEITAHYFGAFNMFMRKSGHVCEYAILFTLFRWSLAGHFGNFQKLSRKALYLSAAALLLTVTYAATDEWHQSFVPGRSACVSDVFVDTLGGVGAWILHILAV